MISLEFSAVLLSSGLDLQSIDINILKEINLNRNTQFDVFFQIITKSVSYITWFAPLILLIIAFAKKKIILRKKALFILSSVILSSIITVILKYTIDRPRPFDSYDFIEKITSGGSPAFPSGHTSEAFVIAFALSLAFRKWYIIIPSLFWAIAVGYSRMSLGVHYPSDVLMGASIGIASSFLVYIIFNAQTNKLKDLNVDD